MAYNEQHDDSLETFFRNNLSKKSKGEKNAFWETPSDTVWVNVQKRLQEQKKRPIFWLWWLKYGIFALVALCCIVFGYQILDDKQTILQLKKQVSQHEKDIEVLKAEQQKNNGNFNHSNEKEIQFKDIETVNNSLKNDNYESKNTVLDINFLDEKKENFKKNDIETASNIGFLNHSFSKQHKNSKYEKYDTKQSFSTAQKQDFFIANKQQKKKNTETVNNIFSSINTLNERLQITENQSFIKKNKKGILPSNQSFQKNSSNIIIAKKSTVSSNVVSDLAIEKNDITKEIESLFNYSILPLASISSNLLVQDLKHRVEKKKKLKKQKRPKMHKKFHFGVFVGMNHTYRRLVATKDMNNMLSNIEKAQVAPKLGSRFAYLLGRDKRFFLETGVAFTQIAIRSEHQLDLTYDSELAASSSMLYKSDILSCLGNTAANINLRTKENAPNNMEDGEVMPWDLNSKQTVSFVSIPLTVRYKFWQTEKLHFSTATSFVSNVLTSHQVKLQDSQTEYAHLYLNSAKLENNTILQPLSFAVSFNINAAFQLKNRWEIWLEPNVSYGLTHIFENNLLKTYPHTIGIQTGISYHFLKDRKRLIFKCW